MEKNKEMSKISPREKTAAKETFTQILEKIDIYHQKFDNILKGCSDIEKAFILGTYVFKLKRSETK